MTKLKIHKLFEDSSSVAAGKRFVNFKYCSDAVTQVAENIMGQDGDHVH
jgi:hypothetical protein